MFTKDCDVGVTFPDKVVTKGCPDNQSSLRMTLSVKASPSPVSTAWLEEATTLARFAFFSRTT